MSLGALCHSEPCVTWSLVSLGALCHSEPCVTQSLVLLVLQLFMIDPVRDYILSVEGATDDNMEDYDSEEKADSEVTTSLITSH